MSLAIENAKDNLATRLEDVPVIFWQESDCFMFSPKRLSKAKLKAMSYFVWWRKFQDYRTLNL